MQCSPHDVTDFEIFNNQSTHHEDFSLAYVDVVMTRSLRALQVLKNVGTSHVASVHTCWQQTAHQGIRRLLHF